MAAIHNPPLHTPRPSALPDYSSLQAIFSGIPSFILLKPDAAQAKSLVERASLMEFQSTIARCTQLVQEIIPPEPLVQEIIRPVPVSKSGGARKPSPIKPKQLPPTYVLPLHSLPKKLDDHMEKVLSANFPFWSEIKEKDKEPHRPILLGILKGIAMQDAALTDDEFAQCVFPGYWIVYYCFLGGYEDTFSFIQENLTLGEAYNLLLDAVVKKHNKKAYANLPFLKNVPEVNKEVHMEERQAALVSILLQPHKLTKDGITKDRIQRLVIRAAALGRMQILPLLLEYYSDEETIVEAFEQALINGKTETAEFLLNKKSTPSQMMDDTFEEAAGRGQRASLKFLCEKGLVTTKGYNAGFLKAASNGRKRTVELFLLNKDILDESVCDQAFSTASASCYDLEFFPETSLEKEHEIEARYAHILTILIQTQKISPETLMQSLIRLASHKKLEAIKVFLEEETPDVVCRKAAELLLDWAEILEANKTKDLGPSVIYNAGIGDLEKIKALFSEQVEEPSEELSCLDYGEAIIAAAKNGQRDIVLFFLDYKTQANSDLIESELSIAVKNRDPEKFALLYSETRTLLPIDRSEAIIAAASGGHIGIIQILSTQENICYRTYERAIWSALKNEQEQAASYLIKAIKAIEPTEEDDVLRSMELFRSPTQDPHLFTKEERSLFESALLKAVKMNRSQFVDFLLKNPNMPAQLFRRAFIEACSQKSEQTAMLFLNAKNAQNEEIPKEILTRALQAAKRMQNTSLIRTLEGLLNRDVAARLAHLTLGEESE